MALDHSLFFYSGENIFLKAVCVFFQKLFDGEVLGCASFFRKYWIYLLVINKLLVCRL